MTALPDISGVPHPPTWPLYPHRWFGRFVVRRRFAVREHGTDHVPAGGAVIISTTHTEWQDQPEPALFGPRPVHRLRLVPGQVNIGALKTSLRVLTDGHVVGLSFEDQRGAAYLALVSGSPVVPLTILGTQHPRGGRLDLVYGEPYRTTALTWPRTKKQVDATALDLRVHLLIALDAARSLTGRRLPGPIPGGTA
jgi:1-acyl-sn-glycerol-3-phosphate acyltransferase